MRPCAKLACYALCLTAFLGTVSVASFAQNATTDEPAGSRLTADEVYGVLVRHSPQFGERVGFFKKLEENPELKSYYDKIIDSDRRFRPVIEKAEKTYLESDEIFYQNFRGIEANYGQAPRATVLESLRRQSKVRGCNEVLVTESQVNAGALLYARQSRLKKLLQLSKEQLFTRYPNSIEIFNAKTMDLTKKRIDTKLIESASQKFALAQVIEDPYSPVKRY